MLKVGTRAYVSPEIIWVKGDDNYWHLNGIRRLSLPLNILIVKQPRRDDRHETVFKEEGNG